MEILRWFNLHILVIRISLVDASMSVFPWFFSCFHVLCRALCPGAYEAVQSTSTATVVTAGTAAAYADAWKGGALKKGGVDHIPQVLGYPVVWRELRSYRQL